MRSVPLNVASGSHSAVGVCVPDRRRTLAWSGLPPAMKKIPASTSTPPATATPLVVICRFVVVCPSTPVICHHPVAVPASNPWTVGTMVWITASESPTSM